MKRVALDRKRLAVIIGTRPEALKLAPIVAELERCPTLGAAVIFSGQHDALLDSVLPELDLHPVADLRSRAPETSLSNAVGTLLTNLEKPLSEHSFDGVIVQGDTNTTLAGALAAYHRRLPVFHVEAGLRTDDPSEPFPEEMNRRLVSRIAALHFAPTEAARRNLLGEGIAPSTVFLTGNPIIDALDARAPGPRAENVSRGQRLLVTLHRGESLPRAGAIASALRALVEKRAGTTMIWVLHKNAARRPILDALRGAPRIETTEPLGHREFLAAIRDATLVLTDSGGVQEEAPALGVPVLLLRNRTERAEAVEAGACRVVGIDPEGIAARCEELLDDPTTLEQMGRPARPFGDGRAAPRIVRAIEQYFGETAGAVGYRGTP